MRAVLTRKQQRAAQLRGRGWGLREIAAELDVSQRTLARWNQLPAFRGERQRTQAEMTAEEPLSVRQTLEAMLLATDASGRPNWNARAQAARTLASLPPEETANPEPQLFSVRIKADGSQEEIWGTVPPGFKSPAAVTFAFEETGQRDNDAWQ